jgi:tetratricopeptide (TPR) repeat protein
MKIRIIFIITLCINIFNLNAQERFLKRAQDEISKNNLIKAYENLSIYEKKEGKKAEYYFIKACIGLNETEDYLKLDTAYFDLSEAEKMLSMLENQNEKNDLCKSIGFCTDNITKLFDRLDSTLTQTYLRNENLIIVSSFLKKYPESKYLNEIKQWRNKIAYLETVKINSEDAYKMFISKYPDAIEIEDATSNLWKVSYENASKINTIESFKSFINKYSNAPQVKEARRSIENIEWNKIKDSKNIDDFKNYLTKYPKSENIKQANDKIESISWNNALSENTIEAYNNFINQFESSKYISEAKEKLENMSWAAIADSKVLSDFEKFKVQFKNSKYQELANLKIKELKSDVLPYLNKNKKYQLFNVSTNEFVDNNEYDQIFVSEKGKFIVTKYNKRGVIDADGKVVQQLTYDCIGNFNKGFAQISVGGKYGFVNSLGEIVIQPTLVTVQEVENRGYIISKEIDGKSLYGFVDTLLQVSIPYSYDELLVLPDGFIAKKLGNKLLLDINGKTIYTFNYNSVYLANHGRTLSSSIFVVENKSKFGITDYKGRIIIPISYKEIISDSSGKYFIVTSADSKSALIDSSKNIMIQPGQFIISYLSNNVYAIKNEAYGENLQIRLYNVKLNKYLNLKPFQDVSSNFSDGLLAVLINKKVGYINENGDFMVEPIYDRAALNFTYMDGDEGGDGEGYYSENNMSSFYNNCSLINSNKNSIESQIWKSSYDFSDGLAAIKIGEKHGFINNKGQIVIPIIYDYAEAFINGVALVSLNENGVSKSKVINTKGETVIIDFFVQSYSTDKKFIFGYKQIDENSQEYFRVNIKTREIEKIGRNFNSLSYYLNYVKGVYKDAEVYLNQKNIPLMSTEINFSEYESMQLVEKASSLIYNNDVDKAITLLDKAIKIDPNNKNAYLQMANAYKQKNYYDQAISFYDKAIDINEDNLNALREKAAYSFENQKYNDAVDSYNKIANKNTEDFSFYFHKGYAENEIGRINESIESYTIYLNNYPNTSSAYLNRGNCYYRNGYYQRAIEDYTAAIKNNKNDSKENLGKYYYARGLSYYYLNKRLESCLDYKRAADLGNSSAINSYRNCK